MAETLLPGIVLLHLDDDAEVVTLDDATLPAYEWDTPPERCYVL